MTRIIQKRKKYVKAKLTLNLFLLGILPEEIIFKRSQFIKIYTDSWEDKFGPKLEKKILCQQYQTGKQT